MRVRRRISGCGAIGATVGGPWAPQSARSRGPIHVGIATQRAQRVARPVGRPRAMPTLTSTACLEAAPSAKVRKAP